MVGVPSGGKRLATSGATPVLRVIKGAALGASAKGARLPHAAILPQPLNSGLPHAMHRPPDAHFNAVR